MNIVANKSGIFIKVFVLFLISNNKSDTTKIITIKLKNHQTEFKKKACVGSLTINHIPVKICHEYIPDNKSIIHE
jgi:hypothetical protein